MLDVQRLIDQLRQTNLKALRLAEIVSIAARVEPALLRRARLILVPDANAGDEADLWFSPLVQTRNPQGFVFYPKVASVLRTGLAGQGDLLNDAWHKLVKEVHRAIAFLYDSWKC